MDLWETKRGIAPEKSVKTVDSVGGGKMSRSIERTERATRATPVV